MAEAASPTPIWMPRNLEVWPISRLIAYANNSRVHSEAQIEAIMRSIRRFGFMTAVLVDEQGVMIAGHGRTTAAMRLGMTELPVVIDDHLSDEEKRAYVIADNQLALMGDWDYKVLAGETAELAQMGMEGLLGFTDKQLRELNPPEDPTALTGQEDCLEVAEAAVVTRPGDLWRIGPHRLLCGSCREPADVARLAAGESIDLVVTSPPYASQRKYDPASGFKPIPADEYVAWYHEVVAAFLPYLAKGASYFLNIKEHAENGCRVLYVKELVVAHAKQWGLQFIDEFCWKKAGVPGGWANRLKNAWEPVFHFARETEINFFPLEISRHSDATFDYSTRGHEIEQRLEAAGGRDGYDAERGGLYNGLGRVARRARTFVEVGAGEKRNEKQRTERSGLARPSNVIEIKSEMETNGHPAPYPVALPEFFIRGFSPPNARIFDPFMGSGTTMVAAQKQGRQALGCELSPKYVDMQIWRMRKLFPSLPVLLEDGRAFEDVARERGLEPSAPTAKGAEAAVVAPAASPLAPPRKALFSSGSKIERLTGAPAT